MRGKNIISGASPLRDLQGVPPEALNSHRDFLLKVYQGFFCHNLNQSDIFVEQTLQSLCEVFNFSSSNIFLFSQNFIGIECKASFPPNPNLENLDQRIEVSALIKTLKQSNFFIAAREHLSFNIGKFKKHWNIPDNSPLIFFPIGEKKVIGFIVFICNDKVEPSSLPVKVFRECITILERALTSPKESVNTDRIDPIFEKLSASVLEGIAVTEKGFIRYVNQKFVEMFAYEKKQILGKPILNFITKESKGFVKEKINNEKEDKYEVMCVKSNGQYFPVEACGKTLLYRGRRLRLSVIKDMSKDRSLATSLHDREVKYHNLFTFTNDAIFIIDPQTHQILDTNEKAGELLGYDSSEYSHLYFFELYPLADKRTMEAAIKDMIVKENLIYEQKFVRKNRSTIVVEINARLVEQSSQKIVLCFVRDVTNRKKMELELARAQRLEAAGQVAGQIAHDFNNLLGPLAAYPSIIRSELPPKHSAHGMLDEMEFSANKITEINQQLLTLGRRGHYKKELINLNDILHKVILQLSQDSFTLKQELAQNLFLIEGGSAQVMRVLMNLIKNSKEAISDGGMITVKTKNVFLDKPISRNQRVEKGEYVKVEVSDTGSGIPANILENIFDPFFTTKRMDQQRGTGLGLSIVHSILDDHKGYISVESKVGSGTKFSIFFPISQKLNVENIIPHLRGGHEKILIVDDDPLQRNVSAELLSRLGYKASCVDSGQEAIEFIKDRPQDLVLMDMLMAGLDGAETYREILEFYPGQKAIIITGYSMTQQIRDALDLGAGAYLAKPVTLLALGTAIRKELDRKPKQSVSH